MYVWLHEKLDSYLYQRFPRQLIKLCSCIDLTDMEKLFLYELHLAKIYIFELMPKQ